MTKRNFSLVMVGTSLILFGPAIVYSFVTGGGPAPDTGFTTLVMYLFSTGAFLGAAALIACISFFFALR